MLNLLLEVLSLGAASAISPVIFGVSLSLLGARNYPRQRALSFLAGAVTVIVILAAAGSAIGSGVSAPGKAVTHPSAAIDMLIGFLFVIFGVKSGLPKQGEDKPSIANRREVRSPQLIKWFAVGVALNITNLDAVMFNLTATKEVFQSEIPLIYKTLLTAISDVLFLVPVLLPVLVYLIMPNTAKKVLDPIGVAEQKYGRYVVMIIFLAFGLYMILKGVRIIA